MLIHSRRCKSHAHLSAPEYPEGEAGVPNERIPALDDHAVSPLFNDRERVALEYADAITLSDRDVSDELFERVCARFDTDAVVA